VETYEELNYNPAFSFHSDPFWIFRFLFFSRPNHRINTPCCFPLLFRVSITVLLLGEQTHSYCFTFIVYFSEVITAYIAKTCQRTTIVFGKISVAGLSPICSMWMQVTIANAVRSPDNNRSKPSSGFLAYWGILLVENFLFLKLFFYFLACFPLCWEWLKPVFLHLSLSYYRWIACYSFFRSALPSFSTSFRANSLFGFFRNVFPFAWNFQHTWILDYITLTGKKLFLRFDLV